MRLPGLAEARDGAFHPLWVDLTHAWPRPMPRIELRAFQVAERGRPRPARVDGSRPDGHVVGRAASSRASTEALVVHGSVEVTVDSGEVLEVLGLGGQPSSAHEAAQMIREYSLAVCGQGRGTDDGTPA